MILEAAGAGVIRQDVQQAIEREVRYRLGEGDAPGALSRWHKELLLLVIQTVKANACLSQLHARAAVNAGATLAQVLQVIQYVELTGMVTWVMVGHDAWTAAEADVPAAQRLTPARDAWTGQEQRWQDMQHDLRRDGHGELSPQWQKLAEVAPAMLDGYIRMREHVVTPDPLGAVPKTLMELVMIVADVVQAHPWGAVRHTQRFMKDGGTVPELIEASEAHSGHTVLCPSCLILSPAGLARASLTVGARSAQRSMPGAPAGTS
jgi:alkylhydroperoxidase/carboxymuconolactone decarboxylase family protein YurZ